MKNGVIFFEIEANDWMYIYSCVFLVSNDTYLQWFQTRIVHRILGTNVLLYRMNKSLTELCNLCKTDNETLLHLFWECIFVQS